MFNILLLFLIISFFCLEFYLSIKGVLTYKRVELEFIDKLSFEEKARLNKELYAIGIDCMVYYQLVIFFYTMYKVQFGLSGLNIYPDALILITTVLLFYAVHICNGEFRLFGRIDRYKKFFQLSLFCNTVLVLSIVPAIVLVI